MADFLSNPFEWGGSRHLPTNTVKLNHIDLTELVTLDQPGEYFVFPHVIVNASFDGVDMREVPYLAELKPIRFEVTTKHFVRPAKAPASDMFAMYRQQLRELDFRRWPQTDLEREVAEKGRQIRQARLARHREFLESIARNVEATNPPAALPETHASKPRVEVPEQSDWRLGGTLLATGTALIFGIWMAARKRVH